MKHLSRIKLYQVVLSCIKEKTYGIRFCLTKEVT